MIYAVLADIHANRRALEAVIQDVDSRGGADQYWCLGDIVDYGPEPAYCLDRMRQLEAICVAGNHDYAVCGQIGLSEFQTAVISTTRWTSQQLDENDKVFLKKLPLTLVSGDFTLAHGSPRDPIWEYILSESSARQNLEHFQTSHCLVGHTHTPMCLQFYKDPQKREKAENKDRNETSGPGWELSICQNRRGERRVDLKNGRFIINPGSVGQPRDNDPRAAYAIFDSQSNILEFRRVEYDILSTQKRMAELEIPRWLSSRLERGE
jgi:predicted phosphodiesterase